MADKLPEEFETKLELTQSEIDALEKDKKLRLEILNNRRRSQKPNYQTFKEAKRG